MAELKDKRITNSETDRMQAPIELDLTAMFKVMQDDILQEMDNHVGTPEELIDKMNDMFKETEQSPTLEIAKRLSDSLEALNKMVREKVSG